ncbi:hypothetical protein RIK33_000856 [Escherichia coli]|nr:hypothetical protein [Escherichia coli]
MKKITALVIMFYIFLSVKVNAENVTGLDLIEKCSSYAEQVVEKSGDELAKIGETPADVRSYVNLTCIDAMRTAVVAKNAKEINQWKIAKVKSVWGFNDDRKAYQINVINTSSEMATEYYYSQHPDQVIYPTVPSNATTEQKVSALELYASQKKIHGLTIKNHCEQLSQEAPKDSTSYSILRVDGMLACQGVMVANITQDQHGIPLVKALDIAERAYGKGSVEYAFLIKVIRVANSLSK